jgi:polysaccharide pyruvyl transferase
VGTTSEGFDPLRVGIVSLFGMYNFGNRLQGFAVDRLLKDAGAQPTTVVFQRKLGLSRIKEHVTRPLVNRRGEFNAQRRDRFQAFVSVQRFQHVTVPQQIPRLSRAYDLFVVGSDQVWHPNADLYPGTQFLQFAAPQQKLALAPSLGVEELEFRQVERYRANLVDFSKISVREERAADIIASVTGSRPPVLPDPTVGLSREAWSEVSMSGFHPTGRYILVNFLGGMSATTHAVIGQLAARLKAQVVDLCDPTAIAWAAGPQDFVSMIEHAELVLTDSFHTCIFATIFEVPFYVFPRQEANSTYSRIATLLSSLSLEGREASNIGDGELLDRDYSDARVHLDRQRSVLLRYVSDAVGAGRQ